METNIERNSQIPKRPPQQLPDIICLKCGNPTLEPEYNFCPRCKADLSSMKTHFLCCGAKVIIEESPYCPFCGSVAITELGPDSPFRGSLQEPQ